MSKIADKNKSKKFDENDFQFLLAEYDRLKGIEIEINSAQHRRFDFYLVAATAAVAGIVSLQQSSLNNPAVERTTYLILIGLLVWGIVAFVNLTYMNVSEIHILNAIIKIQKFFFERNTELEEHFYFRSANIRWAGLGIKGVVLRGITGGGFKSILTVINSSVAAYLSYQLLPAVVTETTRFAAVVIILFLSCILHVLYATTLYKLKPI